MPMTCYRKPGCGFIGFGTPTDQASRFCPGCMRSHGECGWTVTAEPAGSEPTKSRQKCFPRRPHLAARTSLPVFETLVAVLPEAQREVVTMLKAGGLSLEEVARATSCTVGAVKQKARRAYERLRRVLQEENNELP